ncbi:MAG: carboxypeptidase-like regulatory domain-containing protein [Bacteroidota bacterium]
MDNYQAHPVTTPARSHGRVTWYWVLALALVGGIVAYWWMGGRPWILRLLLIALPVALLLLVEWHRRSRRHALLEERFSDQPPYAWSPKIEVSPGVLLLEAAWQQSFSALQKQYGSLLFLIDQQSPDDHLAACYDYLAGHLAEAGLKVHRFFHQGDWQLFGQVENRDVLSLEQLAKQHPNALLICCGDAHRLIHPEQNELTEWTYLFHHWKGRILLDGRAPSRWDWREKLLHSLFQVIPFSTDGLPLLKKLSEDPTAAKLPLAIPPASAPSSSANEADPVAQLQNTYGNSLRQWIAALALFSRLHWGLSLKMGQWLGVSDPDLLSLDHVIAISRLDWFRQGQMPASVRTKLVASLPDHLSADIRRQLIQYLEHDPPLPGSHAHNQFRLELADLKLLIPNFPQKGLQNERNELKILGYLEDVVFQDLFGKGSGWMQRLVGLLEQRVLHYVLAALFLAGGVTTPLPDASTTASTAPAVQKTVPATAKSDETKSTPSEQITGEVVDQKGNAIVGARVCIGDPSTYAYSGTDGRFSLRSESFLAADSVKATVEKEGYPLLVQEIASATSPVRLVLSASSSSSPSRSSQMRGHVRDLEGRPIAGVKVCIGDPSSEVESGKDGSFALESESYLASDSVKAFVQKDNYLPLLQVVRSGSSDLQLVLLPSHIVIRLKEADGQSRISGAIIEFEDQQDTTNRYGKLRFRTPPTLRPGSVLDFRVLAKAYPDTSFRRAFAPEITLSLSAKRGGD